MHTVWTGLGRWKCPLPGATVIWQPFRHSTNLASETNVSLFCFRFELLEVLTFDSVRRRMSVIVKSTTGTVSPN